MRIAADYKPAATLNYLFLRIIQCIEAGIEISPAN